MIWESLKYTDRIKIFFDIYYNKLTICIYIWETLYVFIESTLWKQPQSISKEQHCTNVSLYFLGQPWCFFISVSVLHNMFFLNLKSSAAFRLCESTIWVISGKYMYLLCGDSKLWEMHLIILLRKHLWTLILTYTATECKTFLSPLSNIYSVVEHFGKKYQIEVFSSLLTNIKTIKIYI